MKSSILLVAGSAFVAARSLPAAPSVPTIWLAGDSTMAPGGGGVGTEGWGQFLQYSFGVPTASRSRTNYTLPDTPRALVNNSAIAGRSMRSFTEEGHFAVMASEVKRGDWVVIEMGHNDGGSPYPAASDNGRADCPGAGDETCPTVYNNVSVVVLTYPAYQINAAKLMLAKGARVILSSPTSNNPYNNSAGTYEYSPSQFTYYSTLATVELGGPDAGVWFVQHGQYAAQAMYNLGGAFVNASYPLDHGHTAPALAAVIAQAFVLGLKCGSSPLADLVVNATSRIEGPILGSCIVANSTIPI